MSIERITIIGAGTMGHGIAQVFALAGFQVALTDISLETLEEAIPRIQDNLQTCVKHKIISLEDAADVPGRIMVTTDLDKAVSKTDFIIEAIIEDLETKMILLEKVDQIWCTRYDRCTQAA
jgi:3-hydroxyacyl-CoA dehydrogenase